MVVVVVVVVVVLKLDDFYLDANTHYYFDMSTAGTNLHNYCTVATVLGRSILYVRDYAIYMIHKQPIILTMRDCLSAWFDTKIEIALCTEDEPH